jgi:hypothetical protein
MIVHATTDHVPEAPEEIEHRRAHGLDQYDEWQPVTIHEIIESPVDEVLALI